MQGTKEQRNKGTKEQRNKGTGIRHLITKNTFFTCIHNDPNIVFYTKLFNVGFISGLDIGGLIVVGIDKGFNYRIVCHYIIGYGSLKYINSMNFF
ncbi:hypothetical protein CG710_006880 [Lachnotalea glycerini]|uniref:Uncharacterized protein n=2 Tax=Lachnotalea glycerini TaxID=1763509 RepID=A0A371JH59_9FIRM|nr:hypothetical protein CG710_006880 [Lachnotalea glycerini]